ncbi:hypothetical protein KFZ68_08800 [Photobacterium damselae]|uniref:hypothetical protein n=1 Tax=Photobacterium damselae TaxID=38293 RepID=UPI002542C41E
MSQSINLVAYEASDDGKLYETNTALIETAFVTSALLGELQNKFPLIERKVFEVVGSEEHYPIECFNDSDIEEAIKRLEDIFLSILKSDGEKLLDKKASEDSENLPSLHSSHIKSSDIDESIDRFRTLTNIINIFKLKKNQYGSDTSVVLKLG